MVMLRHLLLHPRLSQGLFGLPEGHRGLPPSAPRGGQRARRGAFFTLPPLSLEAEAEELDAAKRGPALLPFEREATARASGRGEGEERGTLDFLRLSEGGLGTGPHLLGGAAVTLPQA